MYDCKISHGTYHGSFEEFKLSASKNGPAIKAGLASVSSKSAAEAADKHLDEVSKSWGILCLSLRRHKILMWGHYCDSSRGVVIGFDNSSSVFRLEKALWPVRYVKRRVVFDTCWQAGSPEMNDYEEDLMFSKNADWKYEEELRQIFPLLSRELIKKVLENKCTREKTDAYFLPFPAEAVVSVTLGPRCSPQFQKEVIDVLHHPHFSKVKLDRAFLNKSHFKMEFEPVESA